MTAAGKYQVSGLGWLGGRRERGEKGWKSVQEDGRGCGVGREQKTKALIWLVYPMSPSLGLLCPHGITNFITDWDKILATVCV